MNAAFFNTRALANWVFASSTIVFPWCSIISDWTLLWRKKIKILCGVLVCRWDVRFTTLKHSVACILHHEFCCVDLKINVNMEIVQDFCDCWVTVGTCLKHLSVAHPVFWTEWWHSGAISKTKCHVSNFFRLLICSGARMDFWTLPLCL